jgi:hypothetical protein
MCLQFQGPVLVMKNQNYVETVFSQKIITLVLLTLTCNFQISQYDSNISRAFCNPSLFSDKITVSSAYNITNNL